MKTIDFCCGAGGATAGALAAGARLVSGYDLDAGALSAYSKNHPHAPERADLSNLDFRDLPAHEAAIWCPPCEEVSVASGRTAYRAEVPLMASILTYLRTCTPRRFMFENVPAITGWKGWVEWRNDVIDLGYWINEQDIQAADYVPQERQRHILLASRGVRPPRLPTPTLKRPLVARRYVDTCVQDRKEWRFVADATPGQRQRIQRARERFGEAFLLSGYGSKGGAPMDHNGRSLDRPFPTITTSRQWLVVSGAFMRNLTLGECAVAQGFPKNYQFHGSLSEQQAQIGRAVPVSLAKSVFQTLME